MAVPAPRSRISLPLLLLSAGLGFVVYWQSNAELAVPPTRATPTVATDLPAAVEAPEFEMPPLFNFTDTIERPLFMETRRPAEPEDEPVARAAPARATPVPFLLTGIIISPAERLAVLRVPRSRDLVRAAEGDQIENWLIEEILPTRVIVRQGDTREELTLKDKAAPRTAEQPRQPSQTRLSQPRSTREQPAGQNDDGAELEDGNDVAGTAERQRRALIERGIVPQSE